jgi:hypothetical protein
MARIFNIYFTHDSITYSAIVSVRQTPFFTEYTLNNFDETLLEQLPGNRIIARSNESIIFQNAPLEKSTPLMSEILRALSNHLQAAAEA